jgi:DNA topoisomerase I
MAKSLVIVESPAKAKTINKFLGANYVVKASGGHVLDLPERELGIDIEHGFKPNYTVIKGKSRILTDLKKAAREADTVLLATDPDREGEAIAWHVANSVVGKNQPSFRILFNQITRDAVRRAIDEKTSLDLNKVDAQQARRVLDRLVGYKVSPFLWKTVYKGLSAGRVQSVALRLIVERDAEIEVFTPEEYWKIGALLVTARKERFLAELVKKNGKKIVLGDEDSTKAAATEMRTLPYRVSEIASKQVKRNPQPPFITSTLQQEAARRLGFTVSRTMRIAQMLYEGVELAEGSVGLITYMRTDSTRIAPEAIGEVRSFIQERWGGGKDAEDNPYLPDKPVYYKVKKGAQDAHEAIRPSSVYVTPQSIKSYLNPEQFKLYSLIWSRFVASQMNPAESTVVTAAIEAGQYELRASATHLDFNGFLAVYGDVKQEDEEQEANDLPVTLKTGESLYLDDLLTSQHFTKPPAYFTEASLVREMESLGIGRPSTYAQIINTVQTRKYVHRDRGKLKATELGKQVNTILVAGFPDLFTVTFTATMEEELDKIESGEYEWLRVMDDFYGPFSEALLKMDGQRKELKKNLIEETGEVCDKCGSPMIIRWGKNGKFIACSAFPKCRNTRPLEAPAEAKPTGDICDKCGKPMEIKNGRFGRFLACSNYPSCKNIKPFSTGVPCPEEGCDGVIIEKSSRRGKLFYGCNKYPACKFASWTKPVAMTCPQCGSPALLETKGGDKLTCPRCKTVIDTEPATT